MYLQLNTVWSLSILSILYGLSWKGRLPGFVGAGDVDATSLLSQETIQREISPKHTADAGLIAFTFFAQICYLLCMYSSWCLLLWCSLPKVAHGQGRHLSIFIVHDFKQRVGAAHLDVHGSSFLSY